MTQLAPPVTTATGTLTKVYRKVAMPSKSAKQHRLMEAAAHGRSNKVPKGVAKEFLKADSRGEDQRDQQQTPPGGTQHSSPTRRQPPARGAVDNRVTADQATRRTLSERPPAGTPTIDAGAPGARRGTNMTHTQAIPAAARARKGTRSPSGIDEAIEAGARDFNAQVKHRSKMIRDGRKRSNDRHK